jgi:hypothetical protein
VTDVASLAILRRVRAGSFGDALAAQAAKSEHAPVGIGTGGEERAVGSGRTTVDRPRRGRAAAAMEGLEHRE